jgi:hypothetical protein
MAKGRQENESIFEANLKIIKLEVDKLKGKDKEHFVKILSRLEKHALELQVLFKVLGTAHEQSPDKQKAERIEVEYMKKILNQYKTLSKDIEKANSCLGANSPSELISAVGNISSSLQQHWAVMAYGKLQISIKEILLEKYGTGTKDTKAWEAKVKPALESIKAMEQKMQDAINDFAQERITSAELQNRCQAQVNLIKKAMEPYKTTWGKLNRHFKAFLGVLTLITGMAPIVHFATKQGYAKTFFKPSLDKQFKKDFTKVSKLENPIGKKTQAQNEDVPDPQKKGPKNLFSN